MNKLNDNCNLKINEILKIEELLMRKCKFYNEICDEPLTKTLCIQISAIHKNHYTKLKSIISPKED